MTLNLLAMQQMLIMHIIETTIQNLTNHDTNLTIFNDHSSTDYLKYTELPLNITMTL